MSAIPQILEQILVQTRRTLAQMRLEVPLEALEQMARQSPAPRPFLQRAKGQSAAGNSAGGVLAIAEIKRRSPSAGWIRQDADAAAIARSYTAAGAAALSVLTDQPFFGGTLDDLRRVRAAVATPLLRKDFTVDPYHVVQARAAGADAILLIVSALTDKEIVDLMGEAARWGLAALVETHDADEIRRAVKLGARIIGVNHRDLRTFNVDTTLAIRLRPEIPADCIVVAESGMRTAEDVHRMFDAGIDAVLVGESLMRAPDPGAALAGLLRRP